MEMPIKSINSLKKIKDKDNYQNNKKSTLKANEAKYTKDKQTILFEYSYKPYSKREN